MNKVIKKKMTVKEVESLSEKEKNEYQWTLSKTIKMPDNGKPKPDKPKQPSLRSLVMQVLERLDKVETNQKNTDTKVDNLAIAQVNLQRQINDNHKESNEKFANLIVENNLKI